MIDPWFSESTILLALFLKVCFGGRRAELSTRSEKPPAREQAAC